MLRIFFPMKENIAKKKTARRLEYEIMNIIKVLKSPINNGKDFLQINITL